MHHIISDGWSLEIFTSEVLTNYITLQETGKIEDELKFHKSGDYEGIEMIGDDIYVTKNNGTIYEIKNAHEKLDKKDLLAIEGMRVVVADSNEIVLRAFEKALKNAQKIADKEMKKAGYYK